MLFKWYEVPFALGWDEWDEWHAETRRKHPIQHFFRWTLPIWWTRTINWLIKDPWNKLKCRVWHRYNVVVCRSLPPTWCDRDHVLLHVAFQCLVDFIDLEKPWEFTATTEQIAGAYEGHRTHDWEKIKQLYYWWQVRKNRHDEDAEGDDDAMLHRLIDVRGYFWT